ncbi:hypothetical protein GGF31_008090 [Allomyces arbusculus]|nr:hypothetical protein GGF31_008090 [Allomyces arbusculus]
MSVPCVAAGLVAGGVFIAAFGEVAIGLVAAALFCFALLIEALDFFVMFFVVLAIFVAMIWFLAAYPEVAMDSFEADIRIIIYLTFLALVLFSVFFYLRYRKYARTLGPHMLTTAIIGSILITLGVDHVWPAGTTYRALRLAQVAVPLPYPCVPTITTTRALIQWLAIFPIATVVGYLWQRHVMARVQILHKWFKGESMDRGKGEESDVEEGVADGIEERREQRRASKKARKEKGRAHAAAAAAAGGESATSLDRIIVPSNAVQEIRSASGVEAEIEPADRAAIKTGAANLDVSQIKVDDQPITVAGAKKKAIDITQAQDQTQIVDVSAAAPAAPEYHAIVALADDCHAHDGTWFADHSVGDGAWYATARSTGHDSTGEILAQVHVPDCADVLAQFHGFDLSGHSLELSTIQLQTQAQHVDVHAATATAPHAHPAALC